MLLYIAIGLGLDSSSSSICLLKCHQHLTRIIITKTYKMNVTQNMLPAMIWLIGHYMTDEKYSILKTKG